MDASIIIDGLKIYYRTSGKGTPLIILHGWGISSQNFVKLQSYLSHKFKVISLDLPGFGKSQTPSEPWEVSDYANLIKEVIKNLKLKKSYLFGHSFGGRVAIKYAVRYPEDLLGLILCNSAGIKPKNNARKFVFKSIAKVGKLFFSIPFFSKLNPFGRKIIYRLARANDYLKLENEIMKKTFIKVVNEDLSLLLSEIKAPTLLLWGENDKLTPLKDGLLMKEIISDSKLKIYSNVGHRLPYEFPREVSEEIINFLKK